MRLRYFSSRDVEEISLPLEDAIAMAEETIRLLPGDDVVIAPRSTIESRGGGRFIAFPVILERAGVAGVKWLGLPTGAAAQDGRGGSYIILNRVGDAGPFAIVDARWITAMRTAIVSLVGARLLAAPDSRRIAFIACGEQARLHLDLLRRHFPVEEVRAYSRRPATAEAFAREVRETGIAAGAYPSLQACVEGADIVVSSTPASAPTLLRFEWLAQNCFCTLVDLGGSLDRATVPPGSRFVVDHVPQLDSLIQGGRIERIEGVRYEPLSGVLESGPTGPRGVGFLLPTGLGAIDVRMAMEICDRATDGAVGTTLPD